MAMKRLLAALLAVVPLLAAADDNSQWWSCKVEVLTDISSDGARLDTSDGNVFEVSPRGEFRTQVLNWIRGDNVEICTRTVAGQTFYTLTHAGRRVPANLLRGKF